MHKVVIGIGKEWNCTTYVQVGVRDAIDIIEKWLQSAFKITEPHITNKLNFDFGSRDKIPNPRRQCKQKGEHFRPTEVNRSHSANDSTYVRPKKEVILVYNLGLIFPVSFHVKNPLFPEEFHITGAREMRVYRDKPPR